VPAIQNDRPIMHWAYIALSAISVQHALNAILEENYVLNKIASSIQFRCVARCAFCMGFTRQHIKKLRSVLTVYSIAQHLSKSCPANQHQQPQLSFKPQSFQASRNSIACTLRRFSNSIIVKLIIHQSAGTKGRCMRAIADFIIFIKLVQFESNC
jgi:hypothetical protein